MLKVDLARICDGVEAGGVNGNMTFEMISSDSVFIESDESVPRFGGKSEIKNVG
jgi:hypothetical protein